MPRRDFRQGRPGYVPRAYADTPEARRRQVESLKVAFEKMNAFVTRCHGWIVTPPGLPHVTVECTEESDLPALLRERGYELHEVDRRQRLVANRTIEQIMDGKKITRTVSHPGLVAVVAFEFLL